MEKVKNFLLYLVSFVFIAGFYCVSNIAFWSAVFDFFNFNYSYRLLSITFLILSLVSGFFYVITNFGDKENIISKTNTFLTIILGIPIFAFILYILFIILYKILTVLYIISNIIE